MNAVEALGRLRALHVPIVTTADAAVALGTRIDATTHTLRRLRKSGLVFSIRKGLWAVDALPDPLSLAEYLTAPYPSYVSLLSALHLRGLVEAIPHVIYVVSLGRSGTLRTRIGAYRIHHVPAELFGGYSHDPASHVKLARAEKALFDVLYLSGTKTRLFRSLPELRLPPGFKTGEVRAWIRRIPHQRLRTLTSRRLEEITHDGPPTWRARS